MPADREPEFRPYLCSYGHDGAQWSFEIMASSHEDAEARLAAIGAWGRVDGIRVLRIRVPDIPRWRRSLAAFLSGGRDAG